MTVELPSGVRLTTINESIAQQYIKHGAIEVIDEHIEKKPTKRSAKKSTNKNISEDE